MSILAANDILDGFFWRRHNMETQETLWITFSLIKLQCSSTDFE